MFIRRFFAFVISAFLITFPVYSYANTSVGGWSALDSIVAGSNTTINAVKGAGATAMRSAITVAPSALKVGGYLIRGGAVGALAMAVPQILGDGVDWVLDPANNSVTYTDSSGTSPTDAPVGKIWSITNFGLSNYEKLKEFGSPSLSEACSKAAALYGYSAFSVGDVTEISAKCYNHDKTLSRSLRLYDYPLSDIDYPSNEQKSIPIDTVAAQVVANAEAGHAESQEAVKAVALEGFAAGEHDAALDAAAVPDTGVENPPDTTNPDAPAEPVPFDPSSIIAAINSLKAMVAGVLSSMTGFFDWAQADVPPEEEKKPVPFGTVEDVGLDSVDRYEERINFAGQCPVNDFSFSMMGVTYAKPIPYHHLCGFLEQIAPWLLAMCYLGTAYFVVENV